MIFSMLEPVKPEICAVVRDISHAIMTVGTDRFQSAVSQLIVETLNVREFMAFRRPSMASAPDIILAQSAAERLTERTTSYRDSFHVHDPVNRIFADTHVDGTYLARVRREEIRNSEYLNTCFVRPGIREKVTLARKTNGVWTALSLYSCDHETPFDLHDADTFYHLGNLLLPLLNLHHSITDAAPQAGRVSADEMEKRVRLAFPELSQREVSVCARSIVGFTTEGIALDLGIKNTSVLTYRRRAYARLNVNSINQLSTMLIRSAAANHLAVAG